MLLRFATWITAVGLVCSFSAVSADTLLKVAQDKQAPGLNGSWSGVYHYPDDTMPPVRFNFKIVQEGDGITGKMKEPNTFGDPNEAYLYANCRGKVDREKRTVTYIKTYDGTGGISHDVEYTGKLNEKGTRIDGMWTIRQPGFPDYSGKFTLDRLPPEDSK